MHRAGRERSLWDPAQKRWTPYIGNKNARSPLGPGMAITRVQGRWRTVPVNIALRRSKRWLGVFARPTVGATAWRLSEPGTHAVWLPYYRRAATRPHGRLLPASAALVSEWMMDLPAFIPLESRPRRPAWPGPTLILHEQIPGLGPVGWSPDETTVYTLADALGDLTVEWHEAGGLPGHPYLDR